MPFSMNLWRIVGDELKNIQQTKLDFEVRLENWIEKDPLILGIEMLIVGRQVITDYGGRIDLLGIDRQGDLVIIELKRDKTPREIVAQILDYASWVKDLTYEKVDSIVSRHRNKSLSSLYREFFGETIPEKINANHKMIIVASELDDSSERIVQYLAEEHEININVVFFNFFKTETEELIGRAWLMDPEEVQERSDPRPWSGMWFVNVGEGVHRNWDDCVKYGYIGAGQGVRFSRALKQLKEGDKIFAYMGGFGYVGFGEITKGANMIKNFIVESEQKTLLELPLSAPQAGENKDDPDLAEWVVGVKWIKRFKREQAKTFRGAFASPHIVCKLRHQETLDFLKKEFEIQETI